MSELFTIREKKIIHYLATNHLYITGRKLASIIGVSERTVRNDIKNIRSIIANIGYDSVFLVESEYTKGYRIKKIDIDKFNNFLKNIDYRAKDELNEENIKNERLISLIVTLSQNTKLYFISNLMGFSEDKIMTLIKNRNQFSRQYYYKIVSSKGVIKVIGKELEIRLGCLSTVYTDPDYRHVPSCILNLIFNPKIEKQVERELTNYFAENSFFSLSLLAIQYISKALWISSKRNMMGFRVLFDDSEKRSISCYKEEIDVSLEIIKKCKKLELMLLDDDKYFLAILIASFADYIDESHIQLSDLATNLSERIANAIKFDFGLNEEDLFYLIRNCNRYFRTFELRAKFGINRQYMGLTRIKRKLIASTEYSRYLYELIKKYTGISISDKEMVYLAECVSENIDVVKYRVGKKIVVTSRYGYYEAKRYASNLMRTCCPCENNSISYAELKNIEILIDNYDLLLVDDQVIANQNKEKALYYRPFSTSDYINETSNHIITSIKDKYYFYSKIKEENIYVNINLEKKNDVLEFISKNISTDYQSVYHYLVYQERIMSFECGYKSAIISVVNQKYENTVKMFFLDNPIFWHSHFVSFFCVIVVKEYKYLCDYEKGLQWLVKDTNMCGLLASEPTLDNLKKVLKLDSWLDN